MWSAPEDRDQAERRQRMEKKRTPAQLKRLSQRETAFNAGYDAAALACAERGGFTVNVAGPFHSEQRREGYRRWEYSEERD